MTALQEVKGTPGSDKTLPHWREQGTVRVCENGPSIKYKEETIMFPNTIQIRLDDTELYLLNAAAAERNTSVPLLLREIVRAACCENYWLTRQELAKMLCLHTTLIEQIEDPTLRNSLENWEVSLWQFIK
jgi:hypothetical protein